MPRLSVLDRQLAQLALPSLGQWLGILRELARHFGHGPDAPSHPLGHLWKQLNSSRRNLPGVLALYQRIKNGPDGRPAGDQSCSLLQLFDALVQYRNGVFGHGAGRFESFYADEMGPLLFPAVNDLLTEDTFDLLGQEGSRFVYLTELRTLGDGRVEVGLREMIGLQGERMAPLLLRVEEASNLLSNRLSVLWPSRPAPLRLDPLLIYRESETAEEVLFLNRNRNGRQVEYLSYTTGRTEREKGTAPALAALLSRAVNRAVSDSDLDRLAEQSQAETPSMESLLDTPSAASKQFDDYEILAELGRGGMGVVYLARQQSLGRLVALKMLPSDLAGNEVALARFRREIRHLARCEHPNIVKVLASGTFPDGRLYYAMEYVPGCDLEQVWVELSGSVAEASATRLGQSTWASALLSASRKRRQETASKSGDGELLALPLPPLPEPPDSSNDPGGYVRRVVQLVRDGALALQSVHDQQVVHRDVKPANLMLTPDGGRVVLMDFGLAKGQSLAMTASKAGGFLGTLRYAAPEQLAAATLRVGPAADVRALACVLWELLTRQRIFGKAEDEKQLAQMVLENDVPRLRTIDPGFDRDLEAIVTRATERRVGDRIATAEQLAEYLQLYLEGRPLPIRPPTTVEMVWRWCSRNRLIATLSVALAALLPVGTAVSMYFAALATDRANNLTVQIDRADTNANLAYRRAYISDMRLLQQAWEQNQMARARELLTGTRPEQTGNKDLRGFEWHYWNGLCQSERLTLSGHLGQVNSVAFSPDGQRLASAGADAAVKVWDAVAGRVTHTLKRHAGEVCGVSFSADGKRLASAGEDRVVRVWDAGSGQAILTLNGHTATIRSVRFSPDGRRLASGSDDGTVQLWDAVTGEKALSLKAPGVMCVVFSADGQRLASAGQDRTISVWNLTTGQKAVTLKGHAQWIFGIAFSPDGNRLASSSHDGTVKVWDAATGQETLTLKGHKGYVVSVAFSPDGQRLVSASWDHTVKMWDLVGGKEIRSLKGHTWHVTSVTFSQDGQCLASASGDGTVKVWGMGNGQETRSLKGHTGEVCSVAFSPDSKRLASASSGSVFPTGEVKV